MSKLAFLTMVTLVAAILSLSMLAQAIASEDGGSGIHVAKQPQSFQPDKGAVPQAADSGNDNGHHIIGSHHSKIKTIKGLFRSDHKDTGQTALDSIPVIQPLNFNNATTTNASATVTLPYCNGIVPGPCLDKTTGQIIP